MTHAKPTGTFLSDLAVVEWMCCPRSRQIETDDGWMMGWFVVVRWCVSNRPEQLWVAQSVGQLLQDLSCPRLARPSPFVVRRSLSG